MGLAFVWIPHSHGVALSATGVARNRQERTTDQSVAGGQQLFFLSLPLLVLLVLQVTHLMSSPPQPCLDPGFLPSPNFCLFRTTQHSLCVRGPTRAEPQHKAAGVSAEEWDPRGRQAKQAHPVTTQQSVTGERGGEERCSSFPKNSGLLALRES